MKETRRKGYFQGGAVLYGYKIDGRKIVIDDNAAEVVRYIYSEYAKGVYVRDIIAELTAKGILYKGKPFVKNSIYNFLRNEKYSGVYKHGDEIIDNMYPQIVDTELFNKVRDKVTANKFGKKSVKIDFLLRQNVLYANGHTKSKLELKQSNQCKSKSRDSLRNLDFLSTYLER